MSIRSLQQLRLGILRFSAFTLLMTAGSAFAAVCTNGSAVDCNPAGSTINPAAAFVDPSPLSGFTQCAGFINTAGDDVDWNWENNCAALVDDTGGGLFMRLFDDATGAVIAGAQLYDGVPFSFYPSTGFNFRTDLLEGEGFLDNPELNTSNPGTSLAFHQSNVSFCGCGRPPSGEGTCNDIYTTNAANDKILYVGGNSTNHNYEAVFGPPGPKGNCGLTDEVVRVRVAIYAGEAVIENGPARFNVTKTFSDGNEADVEVTLTCNSGLPLQQSFTISGGDTAGVTFVVTDFESGSMDCEVTETGGPDGYTASYDNCSWTNVVPGTQSCVISNQADPATFTVNKEWIIPESGGGDDVIREAEVVITCNMPILNGDQQPGGVGDTPHPYIEFTKTGTITGDGELVAIVDTRFGPAMCSAEETSEQSGVEVTDDCEVRTIAAGGSSECTITNSVFFEGIPSLNQYGLALMALLMLGVGFIGFRRFA